MTTSAKSAFGTKLYRGGSGTPKTGGQLIEEVDSLGPPEGTDEVIPATSHDSTKTEAILAGCVDEGEITIEGFYVAGTGQELMRGTDLGGAAQGYYINLAGGSGQKQLDFSAVVHTFGVLTPDLKGAIRFRAVMKITGAVTWTNQS